MSGERNTRDDGPVVALVSDLIFASRIRGAAGAVGTRVETVGTPDALLETVRRQRPRLILLDLEHRTAQPADLIARLKADPQARMVPVVGFASHTNRTVIQAAREAGADRVLARSAFVRQLPALLRGTDVAPS